MSKYVPEVKVKVEVEVDCKTLPKICVFCDLKVLGISTLNFKGYRHRCFVLQAKLISYLTLFIFQHLCLNHLHGQNSFEHGQFVNFWSKVSGLTVQMIQALGRFSCFSHSSIGLSTLFSSESHLTESFEIESPNFFFK